MQVTRAPSTNSWTASGVSSPSVFVALPEPIASSNHGYPSAVSFSTTKAGRPKVTNSWMRYKNDFPTLYPEVCELERLPAQRMRIAARCWEHESPSVRAEYERKYRNALMSAGGKPVDTARRSERNDNVTAARRARRAAVGDVLKPRSNAIVEFWLRGLRGSEMITAVEQWEASQVSRRADRVEGRTKPAPRVSRLPTLPLPSSPQLLPSTGSTSTLSLPPTPVPTPGPSVQLPLPSETVLSFPPLPPLPELHPAQGLGLTVYDPPVSTNGGFFYHMPFPYDPLAFTSPLVSYAHCYPPAFHGLYSPAPPFGYFPDPLPPYHQQLPEANTPSTDSLVFIEPSTPI